MTSKSVSLMVTLASLALLGCMANLLLASRGLAWTSDGWTYYELSKTVGSAFYRFNTWRSFSSPAPVFTGMPPLHPLLYAGMDALTGLGPSAGVLLNLVGLAGLGLSGEAIGRHLQVRGLGVLSVLAMLGSWAFDHEIVTAGNHTWPLIGLSLQMEALLAWEKRRWSAAWLGVLAGLCLLLRFDSMLTQPALLLGNAVARRSWRAAAIGGLAALCVLLPWMAFCMVQVGHPWPSDNSWMVFTAEPSFVTDYRRGPQPTLFTVPSAWLRMRWGHVQAMLKTLWLAAVQTGGLAMAAWVALCAWRRRGWSAMLTWSGVDLPPVGRAVMLGALAASLLGLVAHTLVGYFHEAYLASVLYVAELTLLLNTLRCAQILRQGGSGLAVGGVLALSACFAMGQALWHGAYSGTSVQATYLSGSDYGPLMSCLAAAGAQPDDGVLVNRRSGHQGMRLGALTGLPIVLLPNNWDRLTDVQVAEFLREYRVRFVYTPPEHVPGVVDPLRLPAVDVGERVKLAGLLGCQPGLFVVPRG